MHRAGMLSAVVLLAAAVTGCSRSSEPFADRDTIDVNIMTFNIEWGGDNVSFDSVIEAVRLAEADIVGVQEAEGNLGRLAAALGWHADERNHVVSRFPLLDPPGGEGKYLFVEVTPGHALALANLHLPSDPYGPDMVRDGAGIEAVLANERAARMPPDRYSSGNEPSRNQVVISSAAAATVATMALPGTPFRLSSTPRNATTARGPVSRTTATATVTAPMAAPSRIAVRPNVVANAVAP